MMQTIINQTDEEKRAMYKKLSKKELIEMLIESNKAIDRLLPSQTIESFPYVPPVYVPNDWPITQPVFVTTSP